MGISYTTSKVAERDDPNIQWVAFGGTDEVIYTFWIGISNR
jgi:hypothetical protein